MINGKPDTAFDRVVEDSAFFRLVGDLMLLPKEGAPGPSYATWKVEDKEILPDGATARYGLRQWNIRLSRPMIPVTWRLRL